VLDNQFMTEHSDKDRDQSAANDGRIVLPVKEWISSVEEWRLVALTQADIDRLNSDLSSRKTVVVFLLSAYGTLLGSTVIILFLQGFRLGGFKLESSTLSWLGAATIGEIAGLLTITIKALFPSKQAPPSSKPKPPKAQNT
jgi:hypothetical protein